MLVHGNLSMSLSVEGIQIVAVAGTIHIAVNPSAIDIDVSSRSAVVGKVSGIVECNINIARHVVSAIHIAMDINVGI